MDINTYYLPSASLSVSETHFADPLLRVFASVGSSWVSVRAAAPKVELAASDFGNTWMSQVHVLLQRGDTWDGAPPVMFIGL